MQSEGKTERQPRESRVLRWVTELRPRTRAERAPISAQAWREERVREGRSSRRILKGKRWDRAGALAGKTAGCHERARNVRKC